MGETSLLTVPDISVVWAPLLARYLSPGVAPHAYMSNFKKRDETTAALRHWCGMPWRAYGRAPRRALAMLCGSGSGPAAHYEGLALATPSPPGSMAFKLALAFAIVAVTMGASWEEEPRT